MAVVQGFGHGPSYEEPEELAAERQRLHDACGEAYERTGTVRSKEWRAAREKLLEFEMKHGTLYNPD